MPTPRLGPVPGWYLNAGQSRSKPVRGLRRLAWLLVVHPTPVPWLGGVRIFLEPGTELGQALFLTGLFEPNQLTVLDQLLTPGMTFVDVGANAGLYSMFAAAKVGPMGRVIALEPSSRELASLRRNLDLNGFGNVVSVRVAAADTPGQAQLSVAERFHAGHNTLGSFGYAETRLDHLELVDVEPLDDLLERLACLQPNVIKIDTEGGEARVLRGATRILSSARPVLFLELSGRMLKAQGSSVHDVTTLLAAYGYTIYAFSPVTGHPVRTDLHDDYQGDIVGVHPTSMNRVRDALLNE